MRLRHSFCLAFSLWLSWPVAFAESADPSDSSAAVSDVILKDVHSALLADEKYPSAVQCSTCHPEQYKEWSASPHAYAQLSPVFNAMHTTLVAQSNGTLADFCIRCHTPVGMDLKEPTTISNLDRHPVSREGVTCIACHRRDESLGKTSGRFSLNHGDIFQTVYGPNGGEELRRVIESGEYQVNTDSSKQGRDIHAAAVKNPQITTSAFCGTCHDVNGPNGFRLEEAFSEYKSSPAAGNKVSCQDCHMGIEPGVASGYLTKPVAIVGGKPTKPKKHADHSFVGPDYSIIHPGIFPHNQEAEKLATIKQWLEFDHQAGWGTDDFEDLVDPGYKFPAHWSLTATRYEARQILDDNLELLAKVTEARKKLLQVGYQLGEVKVSNVGPKGIKFAVEFVNGTDGHNVPTGFDGERVVFLRVTVRDASGLAVFKSGDLDPNGDLRDSHSVYVHDGKLPRDWQLFSLQSRFIVEMVRGGDREQILTTNYSVSPLPFIRPPTNATLLVGRPAGSRKHRQTIPPLSSVWADYSVSQEQLLNSKAPYQATVQIIAGMVPVNLVYAIQGVGFDYGMSPRAVADAIVAGHQVLWEREVLLENPAQKQAKAPVGGK